VPAEVHGEMVAVEESHPRLQEAALCPAQVGEAAAPAEVAPMAAQMGRSGLAHGLMKRCPLLLDLHRRRDRILDGA
jgi:hypothetical protein